LRPIRLTPALLGCALLLCSLAHHAAAEAQPGKARVYLYLAGPGVFLPDAEAHGERRKARLAELSAEADWPFTLVGLYPLDNSMPDFAADRATGLAIYHANMAQIRKAHGVLANMVRFRSPSMDVGTAFEMGAARGLGKPVFGFYDAAPFYGEAEAPGLYPARVSRYYGLDDALPARDPDGLTVENFAMSDNLMMIGALDDAGYGVAGDFDEAVARAAAWFLAHPEAYSGR